MQISRRSKIQLRLQNSSFYLLFAVLITLIAYLTHKHDIEFDWTANQRNTLSATSENLLASLDKPLSFTVYATENNNVREPIVELARRYQRVYANLDIQFINPEVEPALARELGINQDGEVMIHYGERSEKLIEHNEESYSNAIQRLARSEQRWLVFLSGHGERNPLGKANHDLGEWGKQLQNKGIKVQPLNLTEQPNIPNNTAALVIASPQVDLLEGETQLIRNYLEQGGNLLWLLEPGSLHGLQPLAELLGLEFKAGTIVDATTKLFGINDPRIALVSQYPQHQITQNFEVLTLFPQARALFTADAAQQELQWQSTPFLLTLPRSWAETGPLSGEINFDKDTDIKGPLVIGLSLARQVPFNHFQPQRVQAQSAQAENKQDPGEAQTESIAFIQQRVVVIGDGDFLSNSYLGNGGNMDLGMHVANWLTHDDQLINIPRKSAADIQLQLSNAMQYVIAFGFLIVLPILLAGCGFGIWWKRRKQ